MPFTPFHFGPGAIFKAIGANRFSFMVFGGSQFLMDIEPGIRMIYGRPVMHGLTHTFAGAIVIGLVAALIGKPISEFVLALLRILNAGISWTASVFGAFVGTISHVFLDGMSHSDMVPWYPMSERNPMLGLIPDEAIHLSCLAPGALGVAIVLLRYKFRGHT